VDGSKTLGHFMVSGEKGTRGYTGMECEESHTDQNHKDPWEKKDERRAEYQDGKTGYSIAYEAGRIHIIYTRRRTHGDQKKKVERG